MHLTFFHNISKIFHEAIYVLEGNDLVLSESYNAIEVFRNNIVPRTSDGSLGLEDSKMLYI
jgi:hypothetical protein